jgi:hypothetical protein
MLENENSKQTITSSETVCNEKETQWMHTLFHCKGRFGTVRMLVKTPRNLDLYPTMDHKQMKTIDVDYSVRVGYWGYPYKIMLIYFHASICIFYLQ